jgi:outer membrane protein
LEAQVASNEVNVINQENSLMLSLLQLKQAMQLPASTELDVEIPQLEVEDLVLDATRDEVFQTAVSSMPEIKAAQYRIESSELGVKSARGNLYPRITLGGSVTTNYSSASDRERFIADGGVPTVVAEPIGYVQGSLTPVLRDVEIPSGRTESGYSRSDQFKDNVFRAIGLTLSVPIFNGMQSRLALQRSIIAQDESEVAAKEVHNTLRQNVENAYNSALAASKSYASSLKQVAATEEAYRMMKQRYENGATNYTEYRVSENDYFRAKSDLARAKYNFIFTKKVLDFYQNKPIDF